MRGYLRLRHALCLSVGLLALQCVAPAFAQQATVELDPARSVVHFTLKTSLHTVHGTFHFKNGNVTFDPLTGKASGLLVVDAASGESGNSGRDAKMHKEVLQTQTYPEITFAPLEVEGPVQPQGDAQVQVKGTLHLHGQDHEMLIPVEVRISGSDLTLDATFSVPYIAWGLKNPSTFILRASDTVQLNVHALGRWTQNATNPNAN